MSRKTIPRETEKPKKLTRAQKKEIDAVLRKYKGDGKPRTAQATIPYEAIYPDGVCRIDRRTFSKCIAFEDISYQLAQPETRTAIFEHLCDLYNYVDASIHVQLSFLNRKVDPVQYAKSFEIAPQGDDFDDIRAEYTAILQKQLASGNNGIVKTKYLTFTIEAAADGQAPFDITVQNQNADHLGCVDFDALLTAHGMESDALAWRQDTPIYYNDPAVTGIEDASAAIRLSDCNGLLARQGAPAYPGPLPGLLAEGSAPLATGNLGLTCMVIPDEMAEKLSLRRQVWSADYAGDPEETEKQVQAALAEYQETTAYLRVESRLSLYQEIMGNKLLALFLGLYLGLTFLLAAAAVLALQQLSQAADNAARYAVLRRLGAEEGMLSRSAVQQVALAFLLPLALALLHTVVGMKAANDLISTAAKVDTVHSALVTGGVLLAVYGGYFLATALACRRLALEGGGAPGGCG